MKGLKLWGLPQGEGWDFKVIYIPWLWITLPTHKHDNYYIYWLGINDVNTYMRICSDLQIKPSNCKEGDIICSITCKNERVIDHVRSVDGWYLYVLGRTRDLNILLRPGTLWPDEEEHSHQRQTSPEPSREEVEVVRVLLLLTIGQPGAVLGNGSPMGQVLYRVALAGSCVLDNEQRHVLVSAVDTTVHRVVGQRGCRWRSLLVVLVLCSHDEKSMVGSRSVEPNQCLPLALTASSLSSTASKSLPTSFHGWLG